MVSLSDIKKFALTVFDLNDYAAVAFTATQTNYVVGTNARAALPGSWPAGQEALEELFRCDQDCYIRFDDTAAMQHYIPAGNWIQFHQRCSVIYVQRVTANGTLRIWLEG